LVRLSSKQSGDRRALRAALAATDCILKQRYFEASSFTSCIP
jgi:hypothetical protein